MKSFSEIKNGKMTLMGVKDTWDWYFVYKADENPMSNITDAGGLIDPDERTDGLFSGRAASVVHNTEDDLKAVQGKLRNMGWSLSA